MMKEGICPKCENKHVHRVYETASEIAVTISFGKTAKMVYYICTDCGYTEMYIAEKEMFPEIAWKYPKVGGR